MTHRIELQNVLQITPDTRQYIFSRPADYAFRPGQATELALDEEGWRGEGRPFTFTGDPSAGILSFVIKSYPERDGVTARLASRDVGSHALIGEPWGAIEDRGPGVFLAAGTGITPFIAILKARARAGTLEGCSLHLANRTDRDIILRHYWRSLPGLNVEFLLSEPQDGAAPRQIDADYLDTALSDDDRLFYVCGPPPMETTVIKHLRDRGVPDDRIVREDA